MKTRLIGIATAVVILASCASKQKIESTIVQNMNKQQLAWNLGDLEGFMNGYWESDSLRFMGKDGVTYGWKATLDRYRKSYPTKEKMGNLIFSDLRVEVINARTAYVDGVWTLNYPNDEEAHGHFTLLWKKIKGRWVIVSDHSS